MIGFWPGLVGECSGLFGFSLFSGISRVGLFVNAFSIPLPRSFEREGNEREAIRTTKESRSLAKRFFDETHRDFDCFESSELALGLLKGYVRYWLAAS